ncbi:hypothetical protein [Embleya sp. NPDC005575]|uniref:hypothetical protein n=1 Tax=Embleya sp. NPDC005575 TaxID=3156892 RepID=UPI0033B94C65
MNKSGTKVPKMSEDRAKAITEEYARRLVEGLGAPKAKSQPSNGTSPCGNDNSTVKNFWALHVENVVVSPQAQEAMFAKARTVIEGMGFKTRKFATNSVGGEGAGNLEAMNSGDGFTITLQTTSPSEEIMIMISSPCLERVTEWEGGVSAGPSAGRPS